MEDSERDATPDPSPQLVSSSPPVLVLTAEGYYTIPPFSQLTLDKEGQCLVTGFTVGRGYGNIHYPGILIFLISFVKMYNTATILYLFHSHLSTLIVII